MERDGGGSVRRVHLPDLILRLDRSSESLNDHLQLNLMTRAREIRNVERRPFPRRMQPPIYNPLTIDLRWCEIDELVGLVQIQSPMCLVGINPRKCIAQAGVPLPSHMKRFEHMYLRHKV